MTRIKGLALLVLLLGSAAAFVSTPAAAATRNTAQAMCLKDYCFFNGHCTFAPQCTVVGCNNCIQ